MPICQGANSCLPKFKTSLFVFFPEAKEINSSKISFPISSMFFSPSITAPQLISMSSFILLYKFELVASLIDGVGFAPKHDPLQVVKAIRFAPPAICPVAETGSKPGVSIKTNPFLSTFSA